MLKCMTYFKLTFTVSVSICYDTWDVEVKLLRPLPIGGHFGIMCIASIPIAKNPHFQKSSRLIINNSFRCGIFPKKLKLENVSPIFKKGSTQDKDNCRPISFLFLVRFVKRLCISVNGYLEHHNMH